VNGSVGAKIGIRADVDLELAVELIYGPIHHT
jgi:hypothetical protein